MKEKTVIIQLPVVITHDDDMPLDVITDFEEDIATELRVNTSQCSVSGTIKAKSGDVRVIRE